jgi:hypothetical protein
VHILVGGDFLSVSEAVALVGELQDMAMVSKSFEQSGNRDSVA